MENLDSRSRHKAKKHDKFESSQTILITILVHSELEILQIKCILLCDLSAFLAALRVPSKRYTPKLLRTFGCNWGTFSCIFDTLNISDTFTVQW